VMRSYDLSYCPVSHASCNFLLLNLKICYNGFFRCISVSMFGFLSAYE